MRALWHFNTMGILSKGSQLIHTKLGRKVLFALLASIIFSAGFAIVMKFDNEDKKTGATAVVEDYPGNDYLPFGSITENLKGVDTSKLDDLKRTHAYKLFNIVLCFASDGGVSVARCRRDAPSCLTSQRAADFILNNIGQGMADEIILARLYEKVFRENGVIAKLDDAKTSIGEMNLPTLGSDKALVTINLFYDYTSTLSRRALEEVDALYRLYPDRVRVVLWPMPRNSLDSKAEKASRVALAAFQLGKFDIVHPMLIESEGEIGEGRLESFTEAAGLEPESLNNIAISPEQRANLSTLIAKANGLGVNTTPAVFVAGRRIRGGVPSTCMLMGAVQEALFEILEKEYKEISARISPI